jgi:YD repeat-containing protein
MDRRTDYQKSAHLNGKSVLYQYDANDNITLVTNRNGQKTLYTYDSAGNRTLEMPNNKFKTEEQLQ